MFYAFSSKCGQSVYYNILHVYMLHLYVLDSLNPLLREQLPDMPTCDLGNRSWGTQLLERVVAGKVPCS